METLNDSDFRLKQAESMGKDKMNCENKCWRRLPGIFVLSLAMLLTLTMGFAMAQETNGMLLTGNGHGILFDGTARQQAGVPQAR